MTRGSRFRTGPPALLFFVLPAALLVAGMGKKVLVLEIGNLEVPVRVGEVFFHSYTQSMYGVPVLEKFRIEDGFFRLVHVSSPSGAALAYLGIEKRDDPNADETYRDFTIPAASIGNHAIRVHDKEIPLETRAGRDGKIHVKLVKMSFLAYVGLLVWR
ncbi:MAG: DUF1850 domain-containing protein [Desulfomonile sp.]|nr:DUF1850 domain-containing protein [Desulfomonile sp.]